MTLNITFELLEQMRAIARQAGVEILKVYRTDFAVERKADSSPVTLADRAAEAIITRAIRAEITDAFPIVAEEAFAQGNIAEAAVGPFWLVDPLDGTKEFVARDDEFTVNIALIEHGHPVAGVVHVPVADLAYWGGPMGSFRAKGADAPRPISCRQAPAKGSVAMISRHHSTPEVDAYLDRRGIAKRVVVGSSLKFCRIAEGAADIYPRFGRTMEWDTAAGHAVLRGAGGRIADRDDQELAYGKPGYENPHFIAKGPGLPEPGKQAAKKTKST